MKIRVRVVLVCPFSFLEDIFMGLAAFIEIFVCFFLVGWFWVFVLGWYLGGGVEPVFHFFFFEG